MMYRVLHVMNGADAGGISAVVLNYYSHMDRTKVHFDCAITENTIGNNGKELEKLGCKFYYLPAGIKNRCLYIIRLKKILKEGNYDCVHVHLNESSYYALFAGILAHTQKRIAHAHVKREARTIMNSFRRFVANIFIPLFATQLLACSSGAGEYIFGRLQLKKSRYFIIPNSIAVEKYKYDSKVRMDVREELGVKDKIVIGCVGNLIYQKNHAFLIDVFYELQKDYSESVLVIVGSGDLQNDLLEQCIALGIEDKVLFTGKRADVHRIYQGFDVFALSSRFEGFGIVVLEAVASGLNAVVSTSVGQFFSISSVKSLSLDSEKTLWAETIIANIKNQNERETCCFPACYNITNSANKMTNLYLGQTVRKLTQLQ